MSHAAVKDLQFLRILAGQLYHQPTWPSEVAPAYTVHTDPSLTAYGATLAGRANKADTRGFYEVQGYWEDSDREVANITMLELLTVWLSPPHFISHCLKRGGDCAGLYRQHGGDVDGKRLGIETPAIMRS